MFGSLSGDNVFGVEIGCVSSFGIVLLAEPSLVCDIVANKTRSQGVIWAGTWNFEGFVGIGADIVSHNYIMSLSKVRGVHMSLRHGICIFQHGRLKISIV